MDLSGKVVVVTGASMGIGEAIARMFADNGAKVVLLSRDAARSEAAQVRVGHSENTLALACDVREREQIDRALAATIERFGRVDVWVNNAGKGVLDSIARVDMATCRDVFETNFFGAMMAMQAVVPVMKKQGDGAIINISSVAGHVPLPFSGVYSATKFAMNAISRASRLELQSAGIVVTTVCPGFVRTDFGANIVRGAEVKRVRPQLAQGISAERVARAVLMGYRKKKREVIVPWTMHFVVKLYQLFPGLIEWQLAKMARKIT